MQSESDTAVMLSEADGSFVATEAADADTTVESTAVDGIYVSPEDEYFIQADDTHYLMAQKIEFPLL